MSFRPANSCVGRLVYRAHGRIVERMYLTVPPTKGPLLRLALLLVRKCINLLEYPETRAMMKHANTQMAELERISEELETIRRRFGVRDDVRTVRSEA